MIAEDHPLWVAFSAWWKATHPTCWKDLNPAQEWEAFKAGAVAAKSRAPRLDKGER